MLVTPSSTTSRTAPRSRAATGVPHAIASARTRPNGSRVWLRERSERAAAESAPLGAQIRAPAAEPPLRRQTRSAEVGDEPAVDVGSDRLPIVGVVGCRENQAHVETLG